MSSREKNSRGRTCRRFRCRPEQRAANRPSGSRSRSAPPSAALIVDWLQDSRAQNRAGPHEKGDPAWRQAWKAPKKIPRFHRHAIIAEKMGPDWGTIGEFRYLSLTDRYRSGAPPHEGVEKPRG